MKFGVLCFHPNTDRSGDGRGGSERGRRAWCRVTDPPLLWLFDGDHFFLTNKKHVVIKDSKTVECWR